MWSIPSLILILVIVVLLFGTKKLKNIGKDLGGAIKGFKDATKTGEKQEDKKITEDTAAKTEEKVIEGEATREEKKS